MSTLSFETPDMLKSWSHSRLVDFEKCRFMAKLKYIDRIPEPERPLPPGKTEHANDRGTRIHEAAERYVQGGIELIPELVSHREQIDEIKRLHAEGKVVCEGEWAVTRDWSPTAWNSVDVWGRMKLDVLVWDSPSVVRVIDYKTGKKSGNEIKHAEQGQIYALSTVLRHPEVERVRVEFWYTDLSPADMSVTTFTKAQALRFLKSIEKRADALVNCTNFKPNPNVFSCKWCPYGPRGTGHCKVGL